MTPHDLDPAESQARRPFKALFLCLLALMAIVFLWKGVSMFTTQEAISLACNPKRRSVSCELGAQLLAIFPPALRARILGIVSLLFCALACFAAWAVLKGRRSK